MRISPWYALIFLLVLGLATAILTGCGEDVVAGGAGAGNPPLAKVSVSFKANSSIPLTKASARVGRNPDGTLSLLDSVGSVVTISSIEARVKGMDVDLPDSVSCEQILNLPCKNQEATLPGPYTVDLLTGLSNSALNLFRLPPGAYKRLGIEFIRSSQDVDSSTPLDSTMQNLVIRGRLGTDEQPGKAFEIKLNMRNGLEFQDSIGVDVRTDSLNVILLLLNADLWFRGIEMTKCLDSSQAIVDSAGIAQLNGDQACGGEGLRIRSAIETSAQIDQDYQ